MAWRLEEESTSTNGSGRFYHIKEQLGNETRTVEFKQGGFLMSNQRDVLKDTVSKYMCAFLNTEGGTLYVGVSDDGEVVGVKCNQRDEDKDRLAIDQAVKMIRPGVLPDLYTVNFVPVLDRNNSLASSLKVLEVCVHLNGTDNKSELYMYQDDAYVRRDGSVQKLRGRDVQEWMQRRMDSQQEGREQLLHRLCEKTEEVQNLKEQISKNELEQRDRMDSQQEGREQLLHRLCEKTEEVQNLKEQISKNELEQRDRMNSQQEDRERLQRLQEKNTKLEREQERRPTTKKSKLCSIC